MNEGRVTVREAEKTVLFGVHLVFYVQGGEKVVLSKFTPFGTPFPPSVA